MSANADAAFAAKLDSTNPIRFDHSRNVFLGKARKKALLLAKQAQAAGAQGWLDQSQLFSFSRRPTAWSSHAFRVRDTIGLESFICPFSERLPHLLLTRAWPLRASRVKRRCWLFRRKRNASSKYESALQNLQSTLVRCRQRICSKY